MPHTKYDKHVKMKNSSSIYTECRVGQQIPAQEERSSGLVLTTTCDADIGNELGKHRCSMKDDLGLLHAELRLYARRLLSLGLYTPCCWDDDGIKAR